ncbi:hypothetical protein KVP06_13690 [Geobacter sulfurreducens]|uniref:Outer membrane channel n=1 Tax=Geobacter sulfurreducens (strain ATCC 51573 / DSM 12127 / PCA) TaxID=243231 RepID=Q749L6_GEOSL|nr:hypothetical protein [Geobacter sulfurreducens]AAR36098.1 hypothetical protein GSU2726 [Geobacter sulfurreducens PCA]UAC03416.1 hypothetical protein KVP06_13690 [Geobacter sulfurreducens]HBB68403.1 hypothetical protein [Geobacter sulfurreducens]HCD95741.1 hypothetical protein [Geobacter sulfurreducens]
MKQRLQFLALAIASLPGMAGAADVAVDATTLIRLEERSVPGFKDETLAPATQFLGIDVEKLADGNLSFHLYGWGRLDLADKSTDGGSTDGDLAYAYLAYRFPRADGLLKLGRFYVYEGVAAEHVDGVSVRTDLAGGFTGSLFGGVPVRLNMTDRNKGDAIAGGRLGWRLPGYLEIGASALYEANTDTGLTGTPENYRQLVGGDIWLAPFRMVELRGTTSYNTATDGFAEHSYLLLVTPMKGVSVSGEYNDYNLEHFLATTNNRSLFNIDRDTTLRSYGGSVAWTVAKPLELIADYKRINYHRADRGNTHRYGGEVRMTLAERTVRAGLSYHRADADVSANAYHEVRAYILRDATRYRASVDAIAHLYDDAVQPYGGDNAYEVIASLGWKMLPNLMLSGDISYGENPRLDSETRGVVRLVYNFSHSGKGAAK